MKRFCSIKCTFILTALVLIFTPYPESAQAQEIIQVVRSPSNLVIKLKEHIGEIDFSLEAPSIEIYGDGLVLVFYPVYMKRAGRYQMQLSDQQLDALLNDMHNKRIPDFNREVVKQNMTTAAARQAQSGVLYYSSDPSTTIFELNLESYSPDLSTKTPAPISQKIIWSGLRSDARQFPEIQAVQSLYETHLQLLTLMEHPNLVKIGEAQ